MTSEEWRHLGWRWFCDANLSPASQTAGRYKKIATDTDTPDIDTKMHRYIRQLSASSDFLFFPFFFHTNRSISSDATSRKSHARPKRMQYPTDTQIEQTHRYRWRLPFVQIRFHGAFHTIPLRIEERQPTNYGIKSPLKLRAVKMYPNSWRKVKRMGLDGGIAVGKIYKL